MRARPPLFRALGSADPPLTVQIDGKSFKRVEIYKHDSWAATALYETESGSAVPTDSSIAQFDRIVCKFNRTQPIAFIPTGWLGRWLAGRERTAYIRLARVEGIPRACGTVSSDDHQLPNAVAHEYIEGDPLKPMQALNDEFFPRLRDIIAQVHHEEYAYVDLHKRENILVGKDGKPYLIDFQVSYHNRWKSRVLRSIARVPLQLLQSTDLFCLSKHVKKHYPAQLSLLGLERYAAVPWWIRIHRTVAVPLRQARRKLLSWLAIRDSQGHATSETFTEHGLRQ